LASSGEGKKKEKERNIRVLEKTSSFSLRPVTYPMRGKRGGKKRREEE